MFENFTMKYKFQQLITIIFTGHSFQTVSLIITTNLILVTCISFISILLRADLQWYYYENLNIDQDYLMDS